MQRAINLATSEEMWFGDDLSPEQAAINAYELSRGNMNWWDYTTPAAVAKRPDLTRGKHCVAVGDWSVLTENRED